MKKVVQCGVHEYRPHTFDVRGFFYGTGALVSICAILVGLRYGTVFAGESREAAPETMPAAVAAAIPPTVIANPTNDEPLEPLSGPAPRVSAKAYVIADLDQGTMIAVRDPDTPYPIASISKLLTALVARSLYPFGATSTITAADRQATEGTPGSISATDTFLISDLYYPLLMESNNSVANALARTYGKDEFVRQMLRKAHDIGMDETLMRDPSGLSETNSASARDLFNLARTIAKEDPDLFAITRTKSYRLTGESGRSYLIPNFNVFASDTAFLGGKTGYTDEARQTMLSLFRDGDRTIVIVVLQSDDRKSDIDKLRAWVEDR